VLGGKSESVDDGVPRVSTPRESASPHAANEVPRTLRNFLSRTRLLTTLDEGSSGRLTVVRAPGGAGKTSLVVDWLRLRSDGQPVVWVSLDESAQSRAGFWQRVVNALVTTGAVSADGFLGDVLSGYVELGRVPALVLDELSKASRSVLLVLDDFHLVDDASVEDVVWLLERSRRLQIIVTTRRRLPLEDARVAVRLEPTVITGEELAFDLTETMAMIGHSGAALGPADAAVIQEATDGHPLATRVTIATIIAESSEAQSSEETTATLDRSTVVSRIASHAARDLLPAFADETSRAVALRVALAPSADPDLAARLSGRADVEPVLRGFERAGFGDFQRRGDATAFAFHPLVAAALTWEAERTIPADEVTRLRRLAAMHLVDAGDPLSALRLFAKIGDTGAMWPVIARSFSDLINHHQTELESIIGMVSPEQLREEGTLAVALAIVLSEQQTLPSAPLRHLVETALEKLEPRRSETDPLELFWTLLSIFAGLRAARRYSEAASAGDQLLSHIEGLSTEARQEAGHAIGAGVIQIVITYVLVGRLDDAIALAHQLAHDPHPFRRQHRLSLLAYIQSMRGDLIEAEQFIGAVTQSRVAEWRATIPATGWHVAETFLRLERNDPAGALDVISALDSRLATLEHWPYLLWLKGLTRLAGPDPDLGIDELGAAIRANRARTASPFALGLLGGLQSDLYLAAGAPERALKALSVHSPDAAAVILARTRLHLATGDAERAEASVSPMLGNESITPRQRAEALLLHALSGQRLGYPSEAALSARRAFRMVEQHRLRLPLIMVPRAELHDLVGAHLPERLPILADLPDPFGQALTPVSLTKRERLVLVELATAATLEAIAGRLFVSANTVKTQLKSIYRKLGASNRTDAIAIARRRGLLDS
jgi:LuxR family maltose regulon positive regulatory protein